MEAITIPKAEKQMKQLSEKVGCSDDGILWMKEALDPFSDTPRRTVGFPDLITGNSIIQVVKQSKTVNIGGTAQDVHIFQDTIDTQQSMGINNFYTGGAYGSAIQNVIAVGGVGTHVRGGVICRQAAVGTPIDATCVTNQIALPTAYTNNGSTRVIAKAFEVHNTTNKLNVGGACTVYRNTASIPYGDGKVITGYAAGSDTISSVFPGHELTEIPQTLAAVTNIPGSQTWDAEDGCYVVSTMASQTNNPCDESRGAIYDPFDVSCGAGNVYSNMIIGAAGKPPVVYTNATKLFSPFFQCGSFFTGLPAGTELTITSIYIIERFVNSSNLDLVVLAQPSPYSDPVSLELYSKTAARLPQGVKVSANADGDWIKSVADVLSMFGVPGMPLVKGGVDLYNTVFNNKKETNEKHSKQERRILELEERLARTNQFVPHPGTLEMRPRTQLRLTAPVTKVAVKSVQLSASKKKPSKPVPPSKGKKS